MENEKRGSVQKAVCRIEKMEKRFNRAESVLEQLEQGIERLNQASQDFQVLFDWYFEGCWRKDYELDENHLLPEELNRGVLSEDAIYNLFWRLRQLEESLPELERKLKDLESRRKE